MSKLEAIKKAYSKEYGKCNPDGNGWTLQGRVFLPDTELFKNGVDCETKSTSKYYNGSNILWRPKAIKGIENNNNWQEISKLNTSIRECFIKLKLDGDEFAVMFVSHKNCFVDFDNQQYSLDSVEYFIPIVRPNSPIY